MSYSSREIFEDKRYNSLIDRVYYELETAEPSKTLDDVFCLSGRAAKNLYDSTTTPLDNLVFFTADADVMVVLRTLKNKINATQVFQYQNRVVYFVLETYLEFWFSEDPLRIDTASHAIALQQETDIPNEFL